MLKAVSAGILCVILLAPAWRLVMASGTPVNLEIGDLRII